MALKAVWFYIAKYAFSELQTVALYLQSYTSNTTLLKYPIFPLTHDRNILVCRISSIGHYEN